MSWEDILKGIPEGGRGIEDVLQYWKDLILDDMYEDDPKYTPQEYARLIIKDLGVGTERHFQDVNTWGRLAASWDSMMDKYNAWKFQLDS